MYTRVVASRARDLRPRHSVANQWDLLEAIPGWTGGRGGSGRATAVEMPLDPAADARDGGAAGARRAWRPDDELIVLHVSAGNPFRRWPEAVLRGDGGGAGGGNAAAAAGAQLGAVGSRGGDRGSRPDARAPARGGGRPDRRPGRIRPAGAASADRTEPAVRRRRHGAAAHRRGHAPRRSSASTGRRWRRGRRRGGRASIPTLSIETRSRTCPAGRAISGSARPGDFRCLTHADTGRGDRGGGTGAGRWTER